MNATGIFWLVLGLAVLGLFMYTVLPDFLLHRLGFGSWKRQFSPGVALTFDDGPDPQVTPLILDVLAKQHVRAAFFVVGERAERYPELVRRIVSEGHALGLHSQSHRYAWFTGPGRTWREWEEADEILKRLSGATVEWVRPPWGTFNAATWWWLRRRGKRAVLWNVEGHDWQEQRAAASVVARILDRINEGSTIVLHDGADSPGSRLRVVPMVEELCQRIVAEAKLPIMPLNFPAWSIPRRISFILWEKWEHFYARRYHVERIDSANIFRVAKTVYDGPELYAESGLLLAKKGDTVGEIHIDSIRMQASGADMQKIATKALRVARESFPVLARFLADSQEYQDIKVLLSLSMMHRAVKVFGFQVQDVEPTLKTRWVAFLQKMVMAVYHPAGRERLNARFGDNPKLVWIEREKLVQQWLAPGRETKQEKVSQAEKNKPFDA